VGSCAQRTAIRRRIKAGKRPAANKENVFNAYEEEFIQTEGKDVQVSADGHARTHVHTRRTGWFVHSIAG
jgi:hypothetical protein